MAIFEKEKAVRRTITIPRRVNDKDLLALIEVGGMIINKEVIYELFFKNSYDSVKVAILEAYKARGGNEKDFIIMLKKVEGVIEDKIQRKVKKGSPKNH